MKISFFLKSFFLSVLLIYTGLNLYSFDKDLEAYPLKENYEARRSLSDVIYSPLHTISLTDGVIIRQREYAHSVRFQIENQAESLYLLFLNERNSSFPIAGDGNYIIKRDCRDGRFIQIKVFFRNHPGCFIRLFPETEGERSVMDVFLFGIPVYQQVILPIEFTSLLTAPFSEVMKLSSPFVDWSCLLYRGESGADRENQRVVKIIRDFLPQLNDADDGAMDAEGRFVFISDGSAQDSPENVGLNCSGFVKWIVDGFIYPFQKQFLDIDTLKTKHLDYRGNRWSLRYEKERDPYFGLDWSRNLAIGILEAYRGSAYKAIFDPEVADVRKVEFLRYSEDVGYPTAEIELLLYLESRKNPGNFYIGSINREYGEGPILRQHFHLVVLFPYFTKDGSFRAAVFERNQETSLSSLRCRFENNFIHLVRLDSQGDFIPPG